jgi:osmotically-inducible protein OsmY
METDMERTTLTLAALAALALATPALAGTRTVTTDSTTVRTVEQQAGPAAPDREITRDDATLDERVRNALSLALGDDARHIEVDVEDGVVYLGGYIPTENDRREVHDMIYEIAGVRGLELQELRAMTYLEEPALSPQ